MLVEIFFALAILYYIVHRVKLHRNSNITSQDKYSTSEYPDPTSTSSTPGYGTSRSSQTSYTHGPWFRKLPCVNNHRLNRVIKPNQPGSSCPTQSAATSNLHGTFPYFWDRSRMARPSWAPPTSKRLGHPQKETNR